MTTYSISLDDVDLALLPLHTQVYNNFLKRERFEFEVMRAERNEEPAPPVYYTCPICAIQVPAAFASEHAASIKHRANARIASVALERTRGLITSLPPPHIPQPRSPFCANCSLIVDKNHEKTKEHRVAVLHDKLLLNLMAAYVGDDDDDISDIKSEDSQLKQSDAGNLSEKIEENKDINVSEVEVHHKGNTVNLNENMEGNKDIHVSEEEVNHKDNVGELGDNEELKMNGTNYNNNSLSSVNDFDKQDKRSAELKNKIKLNCNGNNKFNYCNEIHTSNQFQILDKDTTDFEIVDIDYKENTNLEKNLNNETESNNKSIYPYPIDAFPKIVNKTDNQTNNEAKCTQTRVEHVEFLTRDNKLVKIHSDHYHGFIRRERRTECIVCDVSFKSEELNSHLFSVQHLNMIPSSMINRHCMRTVNVNYSHCLFCNQKIKTTNVSKHILTIGHTDKARQATKLDGRKLANIHLKSNLDKQPEVTKLDKQPEEFKEKNGVTNVVKETKELTEDAGNRVASVDWPVIYPYETEEDGNVYCVICGCSVQNNPEHRKSHLLGLNHVANVKNKRGSLLSSLT